MYVCMFALPPSRVLFSYIDKTRQQQQKEGQNKTKQNKHLGRQAAVVGVVVEVEYGMHAQFWSLILLDR